MRAYKTEINPNSRQKRIINQAIGVCRFVYNLYISHNKEIYEKEHRFVSAMEFSKWLNNEFIPNNPEYGWIKSASSKAAKKSMMNAEKAFKNFFDGKSKFPRFKKKKNQDVKMYFVKNDANTIIPCERHRIKIPTLGWVSIKEYGYIPGNAVIKSGTVSCKGDRYYVSVIVDEDLQGNGEPFSEGVGIDLGVKEFAVISNGETKGNINKTRKARKLEKKLKREQRRLSRKYENKKKRGEKAAAKSANIGKQRLKVQKLHQRLKNIRHNHVNKFISELAKTKPEYVVIEELNIKGMMKNRHLSKAIAQQNFYYFRTRLGNKCKQLGIELRTVSKWYPSSKMCSCCGNIKHDLRLSDRVYKCGKCGFEIDRDLNAAINLRNSKEYAIAR